MEKYITLEDYKQIKGVDLELEIQEDDNVSNKVNRFIHEVTDWCWDYLIKEYENNELINAEFHRLPIFRQQRFREGVAEQIEYVLNEGWLNKDAGVIRETGMILDFQKCELGRTAKLKFWHGAFCNIPRER